MRENSDTFRVTQVISAGTDDYKLILIPIGVAHGYKVISEEPVLLFYHTTESYSQDSPDEERVPWDDPNIGFDWESVQ
jgi:dTDP-4-dehydrorhamnose 3,5-epimerase